MTTHEKALRAAARAWLDTTGPGTDPLEDAIAAYISALLPEDAAGLIAEWASSEPNSFTAFDRLRVHAATDDYDFFDTDHAEEVRLWAERAASLIQSQAAESAADKARIAELEAVLRTTRVLVSEAAMTSFNCHDGKWAEQLYANQAAISKMVDPQRRSLLNKDRQP